MTIKNVSDLTRKPSERAERRCLTLEGFKALVAALDLDLAVYIHDSASRRGWRVLEVNEAEELLNGIEDDEKRLEEVSWCWLAIGELHHPPGAIGTFGAFNELGSPAGCWFLGSSPARGRDGELLNAADATERVA